MQLDLVFREAFFTPSNLKFRSYPQDFEVFYLSNGGFEGELHIISQPDGTALLTGELTQHGGGELRLPPE